MVVEVIRTPDERFTNLSDYPFAPHYATIPDHTAGSLRVHYIDEGEPEAPELVLCLHGQPTWSYLYRKMVPPLVAAGHRVLCPDLIGFGRSDKPTSRKQYSYAAHVAWMSSWLEEVGARNITLMCQDWGGLIGLRLVAAFPERFSRIVVSNTGLPAGRVPRGLTSTFRDAYEKLPVPSMPEVLAALSDEKRAGSLGPMTMIKLYLGWELPLSKLPAFFFWIKHCSQAADMTPRAVMAMAAVAQDSDGQSFPADVIAGYDAPFPDERFVAGARQFPSLVPMFADGGIDGVAADVSENLRAWDVLRQWHKPLLTAFSDGDPVT